MKKEKRNYEAPSLTVVSFKAEKGFALSGQLVENYDFDQYSADGYSRNDYGYTNDDSHNLTWGTF